MSLFTRVGVALAVACLSSASLAVPAHAQGAVSQPSTLDASLRRAEAVFNSVNMLDAGALLESLHSDLDRLDHAYTQGERVALGRVLTMEAELAFGGASDMRSRAFLAHVIALGEERQVPTLASPRLVELAEDVRRTLTSTLRVPPRVGGMIRVDGMRVDGVALVPLMPGRHNVVLQAGLASRSVAVDVLDGGSVAVVWPDDSVPRARSGGVSPGPTGRAGSPRPEAGPPEAAPAPPPPTYYPEPARSRGSSQSDWHKHIVLRAGLALDAAVDPTEVQTPLRLYGKSGSVGTTYTRATPDWSSGRSLGAMLRLGNFGIGATWQRTASSFDAEIEASAPAVSGSNRTLTGTTGGLHRSLDALHAELTVVMSGDRASVAFYAGPSFIRATQTLVASVGVREGPGSASLSGVSVVDVEASRRAGFNLGLDASWYPLRYAGVGADVRFSRVTTNVPLAGTTVDVPFGGYLVGVGGRLRF